MTKIRFFGVAAYALVTNDDQRLLLDPYLDDNPGA
jgi:L-ascorbate metabolism protein UlaG (beta-lactamase superfamily)